MILQHKDVNASIKDYDHLASDQLLVTKIFSTIQGEGPYGGHPAIFVRLAGCNRGEKEGMGCEFCDTQFIFSLGTPMTFEEIMRRILSAWEKYPGRQNAKHTSNPLVVITGGEPMIQPNLTEFCKFLLSVKSVVQIESNGDRLAAHFIEHNELEEVMLVVSPKVARNGYRPMNPMVYNRADVLKFVISGDDNSPYHNVSGDAFTFVRGVDPRPVCVSPLTEYFHSIRSDEIASFWHRPGAINFSLTRRNYKRACALAMEHGFIVSTQQHLLYEME